MFDEHRTSAGGAELAMARLGFLDEPELLLALHHAHAGCRPQGRRVNRSPEPASTRAAMAERLGGGLAGELHLDRAAEAVALALLSCHRESSSRFCERSPASVRPEATTIRSMSRESPGGRRALHSGQNRDNCGRRPPRPPSKSVATVRS